MKKIPSKIKFILAFTFIHLMLCGISFLVVLNAAFHSFDTGKPPSDMVQILDYVAVVLTFPLRNLADTLYHQFRSIFPDPSRDPWLGIFMFSNSLLWAICFYRLTVFLHRRKGSDA